MPMFRAADFRAFENLFTPLAPVPTALLKSSILPPASWTLFAALTAFASTSPSCSASASIFIFLILLLLNSVLIDSINVFVALLVFNCAPLIDFNASIIG